MPWKVRRCLLWVKLDSSNTLSPSRKHATTGHRSTTAIFGRAVVVCLRAEKVSLEEGQRLNCALMRLLLLAWSACASTALTLLGGPQLACAEAPTASRPRPLLLQLSAAPPPPPPRSSSTISVSNEMLAIGLPALAGLAVDPVASLVDTGFVGRMCGSGPLAGAAVASEGPPLEPGSHPFRTWELHLR